MELVATITDIVYQSEDDWVIARAKAGQDEEQFTLKGKLLTPAVGRCYRLEVEQGLDKYGRHFKILAACLERPATKEGVESYLGLLPGIGPAKAKLLVEKWGTEAIDKILDGETLPSIGAKMIEKAQIALKEMEATRANEVAIRSLLQGQVQPWVIRKVMERWGIKAADTLEAHPYWLLEIGGIGFRTADEIAHKVGIFEEDPARIAAAIAFAARTMIHDKGHTRLECEQILIDASELIGVDVLNLTDGTRALEGGFAMLGPASVYLHKYCADPLLLEAEGAIRSRASDLPAVPKAPAVAWPSSETMAEDQVVAASLLSSAVESKGMAALIGSPGTGKTWMLKWLCRECEARDIDFSLMAPTGKAARRMAELTGRGATTIHRGLGARMERNYSRFVFQHGPDEPLRDDLIVIDESSMIDSELMASLLLACSRMTAVIFVGDPHQLPPVGPGAPFRDLLKRIPVAELSLNKRQNPGAIASVCNQIVHGAAPSITLANRSDLWHDPKALTAEALVELYLERIPKWQEGKEVQILCPRRTKHPLGSEQLNKMIRQKLIEKRKVKPIGTHRFAEGDRVIFRRNNYEAGYLNGDMGRVVAVDAGRYVIELDTKAVVSVTLDSPLDWAWAISVHSSQGSEFEVGIIPLGSYGPFFDRCLAYTAISRCRDACILTGPWAHLTQATKTVSSQARRTILELD